MRAGGKVGKTFLISSYYNMVLLVLELVLQFIVFTQLYHALEYITVVNFVESFMTAKSTTRKYKLKISAPQKSDPRPTVYVYSM